MLKKMRKTHYETGHGDEEGDLEETEFGAGEDDGEDAGAGRPAAINPTDE